jgi:hypothetical protein
MRLSAQIKCHFSPMQLMWELMFSKLFLQYKVLDYFGSPNASYISLLPRRSIFHESELIKVGLRVPFTYLSFVNLTVRRLLNFSLFSSVGCSQYVRTGSQAGSSPSS